jgi:hypothetical protein
MIGMTLPVSAARTLSMTLLLLSLSGCTSFGRGVTEALIQSQAGETVDARTCTVDGEAFHGISPMLEAQAAADPLSAGNRDRATTKLVYIHGIGDHQPGHSGELVQSLSDALGLHVRASITKQIELAPQDNSERPFGIVTVIRLTDSDRRRELIFYELTWSVITAQERQSVEFDNSVFFSSQRASINSAAKQFANNALTDPLAFIGDRGEDIRGAVGQTFCWAMSARWDDLPKLTEGQRCENSAFYGDRVAIDEVVLASHSLGSRATVDALQDAAQGLNRSTANQARVNKFTADLKDKEISLYMLSNQLPLLESGQPTREITAATSEFCGPNAPQASGRFLKQLNLIAFTDPNDILSYPVPQFWARRYLDSRLCTNVRNVTINIATVRRLPVLGTFADPLAAHTGYDSDARVAQLIVNGIGNDNTSELVRERCQWVEVDPSLD